MTEQEYKDGLRMIEQERSSKRNALMVEYAKEQRRFNIGDIIESYGNIIEIQSFGTNVMSSESLPESIYRGKALTKKLQPKKINAVTSIYGNNNVNLLKAAEILETPKI